MKIAFLGDIALFGKYSLENEKVFKYFEDVALELRNYDHVVGNLETPLCNNTKPYGCKSVHIRSAEENIELLKYLGIDIVSLANNHIFDYGIKGYDSTSKILLDHGIEYFGIEGKQVRLEDRDTKVVLSGFCCYSTNALGYYDGKSKVGVNPLKAKEIENILLTNNSEGYFNIVSVHAGQEHVNMPNYDHIELARSLAKKVSFLWYGHHPHVIQGMERLGDSLVAYSLGNFCFDDVYSNRSGRLIIKQSSQNKQSFLLSLDISKNRISETEIIPLFAGENLMMVGDNTEILRAIQKYSDYLDMRKEEYDVIRNQFLADWMSQRKRNRNLRWYWERLNFNTIGMLWNAASNKRKYFDSVINYIEEEL